MRTFAVEMHTTAFKALGVRFRLRHGYYVDAAQQGQTKPAVWGGARGRAFAMPTRYPGPLRPSPQARGCSAHPGVVQKVLSRAAMLTVLPLGFAKVAYLSPTACGPTMPGPRATPQRWG